MRSQVVRPVELPERPLRVRASTAVRSTSALCTGGDVADVFAISDASTAVVVADCAGHGAQATPNAQLFRAAARSLLSTDGDLVDTAKLINRLFYQRVPTGMIPWPFVSVFLGVFDSGRRTLRYISCGHDAALLFRGQSEHIHLTANAPLLGLTDSGIFSEESLSIRQQDALVVTTDGVTEARARHSDNAFFGAAGVCKAFRAIRGATNDDGASDDAVQLLDHAQAFCAGRLVDDAAAIVAHFE